MAIKGLLPWIGAAAVTLGAAAGCGGGGASTGGGGGDHHGDHAVRDGFADTAAVDSRDAGDVNEGAVDLALPEAQADLPGDLAMPVCGDGACDPAHGEGCISCPGDCGECTVCGNALCEKGVPAENPVVCPQDCGWCGDGVCSMSELKSVFFCALDCGVACGDGKCDPGEASTVLDGFCAADCGGCFDGICGYQDLLNPDLAWCMAVDCDAPCGDGKCGPGEGWNVCPVDCCVCGDGVCGKAGTQVEACPADCVKPCGDGKCEGNETPEGCAADCGPCGDGVCGLAEMELGYCDADCPVTCGDQDCQDFESSATCPGDCACLPSCQEGWNCGPDDSDCGQSCGACTDGIECIDHECCVPACKGKECGDDGCAGECGKCPDGFDCQDHSCVCVPTCSIDGQKLCGDDGCGGDCGGCDDGLDCTIEECADGFCLVTVQKGNCHLSVSGDTGEMTCAPAGAQHPYDPCKLCLPLVDVQAWSPEQDGVSCGVGMVCFKGACCDKGDNCAGIECGDDGCGAQCGVCPVDVACVNGKCLPNGCVPDCSAKGCGDDGCGGSCGDCDDGLFCTTDKCLDSGKCLSFTDGKHCLIQGECMDNYTKDPEEFCRHCEVTVVSDGWTFASEGLTCGVGKMCYKGTCCDAASNCLDKECGPTLCGGGICGLCPMGTGCVAGTCVALACESSCISKQCGDDGCGGDCGPCPPGFGCQDSMCVCTELCAGKACGDDGCGGTCGTCAGDEVCDKGTCVSLGCMPSCWANECGDDGCGGLCGTCPPGSECANAHCWEACDDQNLVDWDGCTSKHASELAINSQSQGTQGSPAVATTGGTQFAVAWSSDGPGSDGSDVFVRAYAAGGNAFEADFLVNTATDGAQEYPDIVGFQDGSFVVVWESSSTQPGHRGIMARRFTPTGTPTGPEYNVAYSAGAFQHNPVATRMSATWMAVAWDSGDNGPSKQDVYMQFMAADGSAKLGPLAAHAKHNGLQQFPSIASATTERTMVVWESCGGPADTGPGFDGDGCGVFGAIVDAEGMPVKVEFQVNSPSEGDQRFPVVTVAAGAFFSQWKTSPFGTGKLSGTQFNTSGLPLAPESSLGTTPTTGIETAASAGFADGRLVVVYEEVMTTPQSAGFDIAVQTLDKNMAPVGPRTAANLHSDGAQRYPDVAFFDNGAFVVVWQSCNAVGDPLASGQDGNGCGVFGRRFNQDGTSCQPSDCTVE